MTHIAAAFDLNNEKVPFIAVAVKHGNACGAAVGNDPLIVLGETVMGDPQAIFGGLVMTNFSIDEKNAEVLLKHGLTSGKRLLDGVIAPNFTEAAITFMRRKADKCRFLSNMTLASLSQSSLDTTNRFRFVRGGFLLEPNYTYVLNLSDPQLERFGELTEQQKEDILLAWAINATSNSNTITLVKNKMLLGNGVGQQDRVSAAELAIKKAGGAGHDPAGAVAASDSFFPFPDGPQRLTDAGIKVIFATSGSIRDEAVKEVIAKADVTFLRLPDITARGFFGH
jgi:phosphoribosylaminoimidazolecarboxamide formyltransferase/IMP cyclohydrolase